MESPNGTQNEKYGGKDATKHKRKSNRKKAEIVAVFAVIEIISLVLWQKAEDFPDFSGKYIHWFSECGFLAGGAYLAYEFTKRRSLIWFSYAVLCVVLLLSRTVEPKPHFTISLQMGDNADTKISLTNDFLFDWRVVKTGNLPNGKILFNGFVNGCLVIPVHDGETNKVFNFIAENDSQVKVSDLQLIVGFPKNLQCGVDPSWHKIEESFIIPREWKFDATNMQFFLAQSPVPLFPYDWWGFPSITNPCISEYNGSSFQGGLVELSVRSTGFETMLAANVIFVPAETNFSKPYIGLGQLQTNGTLLIPLPPEVLK
jgi:hypothetical protein